MTILRGATELVRGRAELVACAGRLTIDPPREPLVPWVGMRHLVAELDRYHGPALVEPRLRKERTLLSLVLRGMTAELSRDELELRLRHSAQAPGYLSHNAFISFQLRQAWVNALAPLLDGLEVAVPDVGALDFQSTVVLRGLLAAQPALSLTFGHDASSEPADPLRRRRFQNVVEVLEGFAALDCARVVSVAEQSRSLPVVPARAVHVWDDRLEERAYAALKGEGTIDVVVAAVEAAFACFGFTTVLGLGLDLLGEHAAALSPAVRRRIHMLVALSAYNRQVRTRSDSAADDEALAALLEHHFTAALAGEDDPAARAHLLYRLAINTGRRRGELPAALELAEQSVREARRANAPFHEAWALNGRAYVRGRMAHLDAAIADVERAFTLTEKPLCGALEAERPMSRAVLADNLAALHTWRGDRVRALAWQEAWHAIAKTLDAPSAPSERLIQLLRDSMDLERAIELAEKGRAVSDEFMAPLMADFFSAQLAELWYRRGDAARAHVALERALAITRRTGEPHVLRGTLMATALAAWRHGNVAVALQRIEELLSQTDAASTTEAELRALFGVVKAEAGDVPGADAEINRAIDLATAAGERDVLLRVACAAGEACLLLGREADAASAYAQAWEIATQGTEPPSAADQLEALTGLLETSVPTAERVQMALDLLEAALTDAESWWRLDSLWRAYQKAPCGSPDGLLRAIALRVNGSARTR